MPRRRTKRGSLLPHLLTAASAALLLLADEAATASPDCPCFDRCADALPPQYTPFTESSGEKRCFRGHYGEKLTWEAARHACNLDGGWLAESGGYLSGKQGHPDVWVGAQWDPASAGLRWRHSGAVVPTSLLPPPSQRGTGGCGFLFQNTQSIYRFSCEEPIGFLCEKPAVSFTPQATSISAARGAGAALGSESPPVLQIGASVAPATLLLSLAESGVGCTATPAAQLRAPGADGAWPSPTLSPGTTYTLCWYGPLQLPQSSLGKVRLRPSAVTLAVLPLPTVAPGETLVPAGALPSTADLQGENLAEDALVGLFASPDCSDATPAVLVAGAKLSLPATLEVRRYTICVAAWGGTLSDAANASAPVRPAFTPSPASLTVQPLPTFTPRRHFLPYAVLLSGGGITLAGANLQQDYIWISLRAYNCEGAAVGSPAVLPRGEPVFRVPEGSKTGWLYCLCFVVSADGGVAPVGKFSDTGVSLGITPALDVTELPPATLPKSYAEARAGAAVEVAGRYFSTRGSPSMLFVATSATASCTPPLLIGSEVEGKEAKGLGTAPPADGGALAHICIVAAVNSSAAVLKVYPTPITLDLAAAPAFTPGVVWASSLPLQVPAGENLGRTTGLHFALANDVKCQVIIASAEAAMPAVALPQSSHAEYHMCWGASLGGVPAEWHPSGVVFRLLPEARVVETPNTTRLPEGAYGLSEPVTVEITGSYLREMTARWVRSGDACSTTGLFEQALACDPWCSARETIVPAGLLGGQAYQLCAVLPGGAAHPSGVVVVVVAPPAAAAQSHILTLSDVASGADIALQADNTEFAFTRLVAGGGEGCAASTGGFAPFSAVLRVAPGDTRFPPGQSVAVCVASGVAQPSSGWRSFNITASVMREPQFVPQERTPTPAQLWATEPLSVALSGDALSQPLWYHLCAAGGCTACAAAAPQRSSSAAVSLPHAWVRGHAAGGTAAVCWSVTQTGPRRAAGTTIVVPAMVPLGAATLELTYAAAVPGPVAVDLGAQVPSLWAALSAGGELVTPWHDASGGLLSVNVTGLPTGVRHTVAVAYSSDATEWLPSEVALSWAGRPVFDPTTTRLTLQQQLGGATLTLTGSFIQQGIAGRIGCAAPRPPLPDFEFRQVGSTTSGTADIQPLQAVQPTPQASHALCWAPVETGSPARWDEGGDSGVVVTLDAVPGFTAQAYQIDRVAVLSGTGVVLQLAGTDLDTPLWAVLASDTSCTKAVAVAPLGNATSASADVAVSAAAVGGLPPVAHLCWSAFSDGRLPQPTGATVAKQSEPLFTPYKGLFSPEQLVQGLQLPVTVQGGTEGLFVRLVTGEGCATAVSQDVETDALTLNADTPLGNGSVYACWLLKGPEGALLSAAQRVPSWGVSVVNYPVVEMVAGTPLPWAEVRTAKNTHPLTVGGYNLPQAALGLVPSSKGCAEAVAAALPLEVGGLVGSYRLCMAVRGGGVSGAFFGVPGMPQPCLLLADADPTQAPPTPGPTLSPTEAPPTPHPDTPAPTDVPPDTPSPSKAPDTEAPTTHPDTAEPSEAPTPNPSDSEAPETPAPTDTGGSNDTSAPPTPKPGPVATPIPLPATPQPTEAPQTAEPDTPEPVAETPAPPPCPTVDVLGVLSSARCFSSGSLNEAGRLVGCLRSGSFSAACMAQYSRCVDDVVGGCPDGKAFSEGSAVQTFLLDIDYDSFATELFTAAVAAEARVLPWLVRVDEVRRGSVAVSFRILGPNSTRQMEDVHRSAADGTLFALYNWTVLSTPPVVNVTDAPVSPPEAETGALWPALAAVALCIGVVLAAGITAGHRYTRLAEEVCMGDLVVPTPQPTPQGDSEAGERVQQGCADVTGVTDGGAGIVSCPSSGSRAGEALSIAEQLARLQQRHPGAFGGSSGAGGVSPARRLPEACGPTTPLPFDKPLPSVPTPASSYGGDITPSRSPLPPVPHP